MSDSSATEGLLGEEHEAAKTHPQTRLWMRRTGLLLMLLAGLLAWYLGIFYVGWQRGQADQEQLQEAKQAEQLETQVELARQDMDSGSYALAQLRLEWVLERSPDDPEALSLYGQTQSELERLLTPAVVMTPTSSPTPIPSPTPTPVPIEDPTAELDRLRELVSAEKWEEAVPALVSFQWQFPSSSRQETDAMLFDAYIGLGLSLLQGEQVEHGLAQLEQAEKLGDLPESVLDHRTWAEIYLQGIAFYNVNWGATVYYFRDLCLAAPFYQSSCDVLFQSLIEYGNQYATALDWCPALPLYEEALLHGRSQSLSIKLRQAREECSLATATPAAPDSNAFPITNTQSLTGTFQITPSPSATPSRP
jgi:tetratricopeptide (TPR) repeat protein